VLNGVFGVKVRNADGLIVISDQRTGFLGVQDGRLRWVVTATSGECQMCPARRTGTMVRMERQSQRGRRCSSPRWSLAVCLPGAREFLV